MKTIDSIKDVYKVLEVNPDATTDQIRAAYLSLVQKYPPDRAAEKFAEIHQAYQWLTDPLAFAEAILRTPSEPPDLLAIIDKAAANPPRLTPAQLLSLGNVSL